MEEDRAEIVSIVKSIMISLSKGDFVGLARSTGNRRLSAPQIEQAVRLYGRTLVDPSDDVLKTIDIVTVANPAVRQYSVVADLWTKEEGRSDLSLEVTIFKDRDLTFEIDNLHVR